MFRNAISKWGVPRILWAVASSGVLALTGLGYAANADAMPDPRVPNPPVWCPGNAPGISATSYGSYCEGKSFADGTRLNIYRIGWAWQPMRCIIPNGTPSPTIAGPSGCGGVLG